MNRSSWMVVMLVLCMLLAATADEAKADATAKAQATGEGASAKADAKADAKATGDASKASASASASASAGTKAPKVSPEARAAFKAYVSKCDGARYDPKVTTPGECANLSGSLCSRKDVKCAADTTDFLDASGAVVATGTHKDLRICDKAGACEAA